MRAGPGAVALALVLLAGAPAPRAQAAWSNPERIAAPFTLDVAAPSVALAPSGAAAIGFTVQDGDAPANSTAYALWRSAAGGISPPQAVAGALQTLAVSNGRDGARLLSGSSPAGSPCCTTAAVSTVGAGGVGRPQVLVRTLAGATTGRLVPVTGATVAVLATGRGVWVAQSGRGGRFGPVRRLAGPQAMPETMAAAAVPGGGAAVAWAATRSSSSGPTTISVATGAPRAAPKRGRTAVTVRGGRTIDEVVLAADRAAITVAWTESWFTKNGDYRSDVAIADLVPHGLIRRFGFGGDVASGLSLGADASGHQVLAFSTCTSAGPCSVRALVRGSAGRFGSPQRLGGIDATDAPVAALAPGGQALVGWISGGHVLARSLGPGQTGFSPTVYVSRTPYAADLDLAFSSSGTALAVWTQGTLAPEIVGAQYRSR